MHVIGSGFIHNGNTAPEYQQSCARTTITSLHDGTLMATCRLDKERDTLGGHHGLFVSSDLGETWEMRSHSRDQGSWGNEPGEVLSFTPMEHEPGVITATGLWLDRSRPEFPMANPGTQGFLPMRIFHTTSTDGGRTWDGPHPTGIQGQTMTPVWLGDDRYLIVYNKRFGDQSVQMCLVRASGSSWTIDFEGTLFDGQTKLELSDEISSQEQIGLIQFGYPMGVYLNEQTLLTVHWCAEDGVCGIRWTRVRLGW